MELKAIEVCVDTEVCVDSALMELNQIQLALVGGGNADISLN